MQENSTKTLSGCFYHYSFLADRKPVVNINSTLNLIEFVCPLCAELGSPGNVFQCQLWRNFLVLEGKILKPWILHHVSVVMSPEQTLRILSPAAITDPNRPFTYRRNRVDRICPNDQPSLDSAFTLNRMEANHAHHWQGKERL